MRGNLYIVALLLIVLLAQVSVAFAWEAPELPEGTTWGFSDDLTQITINEKVFDNYVLFAREGKKIYFYNSASDYLFREDIHKGDVEYFFGGDMVKIHAITTAKLPLRFAPHMTLLSVNYLPWQKHERLKEGIERLFDSRYLEKYLDIDTNGYEPLLFSDSAFYNEKYSTLEEMKLNEPLDELMVWAEPYSLMKSSEEASKNGYSFGQIELGMEPVCTFAEFLGKYQSNDLSSVPLIATKGTSNEEVGGEEEGPSTGTKVELQINSNTISINGKSKVIDVAPYLNVDTTLIPLRGVMEGLGAHVAWLPSTRQVRITKGDTEIVMQLDSKIAHVNDDEFELHRPAILRNSRTMIPVRFVSEGLGYTVNWHGAEKRIEIID